MIAIKCYRWTYTHRLNRGNELSIVNFSPSNLYKITLKIHCEMKHYSPEDIRILPI